MNKDPFDYLLPYIISLGKEDGAPYGSGTLVQFSVSLEQNTFKLYSVITATHVLEEIGLLKNINPNFTIDKDQKIMLSKPIDRSGKVCGVAWIGFGFSSILDKKHYRHLIQNQKEIYIHNERDIALLLLAIDKLPANDLINNSSFYDLDSDKKNLLLPDKFNYVFYKGACASNEEIDKILTNTGIHIVPNGKIKSNTNAKFVYHEIPYENNISLHGSSGAGLWAIYSEKGTIAPHLHGILVENPKNKQSLIAIDISYAHNVLIPKIKELIITMHKFQLHCKNKQEIPISIPKDENTVWVLDQLKPNSI